MADDGSRAVPSHNSSASLPPALAMSRFTGRKSSSCRFFHYNLPFTLMFRAKVGSSGK